MAKSILDNNVPGVAYIQDTTNNKTYNFPFNINSLQYSYQMNTKSYDTIGGRVTQLLSVRMNTMSIEGEAGNRTNLINLYENFKTIQDHQNQNKTPMILGIPSRDLKWHVYLKQMQMGFDISTIIYPYNMNFEVEQDVSNFTTNVATSDALNRLSAGVGFNDVYLGLATAQVNTNFQQTITDLINAQN